ncbi:Uncharacterised protein [Escherichia coli]|jgi:G3E family GTPase|nr:hypothetical protein WP4S18E07_P11280 [Escherichia coli]BDO87215.1 hypothetical protein TUM9754_46940 [Escherichia coli]SQZ29158.1 Uncharacterised protein [Escherichia coli]
MFCNRLLLTRYDRLPFDIISAAAKTIHPLTPFVDVLAVSWENVELSTLLALTEYNFDRVDLLISEPEALDLFTVVRLLRGHLNLVTTLLVRKSCVFVEKASR